MRKGADISNKLSVNLLIFPKSNHYMVWPSFAFQAAFTDVVIVEKHECFNLFTMYYTDKKCKTVKTFM